LKIFYIILILLSFLFFSFDWPVKEKVLTATFGESRWDHFHSGIDIGGGEQPVYPIDSGEVVFYYNENEKPWDIPTGLGNFIVVDHGGGIRSLYSHLKTDSIDPSVRKVSKEDKIGVTGSSGGSYGIHLHLELLDQDKKRGKNQVVNPLPHLRPKIQDTTPPVILGLYLKNDEDTILNIDKMKEIPSGNWNVILEAYDLIDTNSYSYQMAPYNFVIELNGEVKINITIDTLEEKNGTQYLITGEDLTFQQFYLNPTKDDWKVVLGSIPFYPGETYLKAIVKDTYNNETIKNFVVKVNG
jgi:hypothetical protein